MSESVLGLVSVFGFYVNSSSSLFYVYSVSGLEAYGKPFYFIEKPVPFPCMEFQIALIVRYAFLFLDFLALFTDFLAKKLKEMVEKIWEIWIRGKCKIFFYTFLFHVSTTFWVVHDLAICCS